MNQSLLNSVKYIEKLYHERYYLWQREKINSKNLTDKTNKVAGIVQQEYLTLYHLQGPKKEETMTEKELQDNFSDLLFSVRRSSRYHTKCLQFYDHWSKRILLLTTLSGVGTFTAGLATHTMLSVYLAFIVALASISELIFGFSNTARLHSELSRQFIALEKAMIQIPENKINEQHLSQFTANRLEIEQNEPPKKNTLDIICHNELSKAMGYDHAIYKINYLARKFANYFDIQTNYKQLPV